MVAWRQGSQRHVMGYSRDPWQGNLPGVAVMKNSACSVTEGFLKVWIALGGTTMSSPSAASMLPSGVSNLMVPAVHAMVSDLAGPRSIVAYAGWPRLLYRTFGDDKAFVVEAMPVHRRARSARRQSNGHAPDSVVSIASVFEDITLHGSELDHLSRFFLAQLDRDGTTMRHDELVKSDLSCK